MSLFREIRRRARHVYGPVLGIGLFAYFTAHAFQGDRGILAWVQLKKQVAEAEETLVRTSAQRAAMEHRISLLRRSHLDPDMLEERARAMTGLGYPDDVVILLEPQTRPR